MHPIRSVKNQYHGVNTHLHRYWQARGGWNSFHSAHIDDLMRLMKIQLRPKGYTVDLEQSVQIRRLDEPVREPEADVIVYDPDSLRAYQPTRRYEASTGQLVDIPEALDLGKKSEKRFNALAIYRVETGRRDRGKPVAWIELLSPSNKPGGVDAREYATKRATLVENGIVFLEMDYLHESGTTLHQVPQYRVHRDHPAEPASHPYRIALINPRPDSASGRVYVSEFDVDARIANVKIPLSADDVLDFDFDSAYQKTFEEAFYGDEVDYSQPPLNFERYTPDDQARILTRMVAVLQAGRDRLDLEVNAPLPVEPLSLEAAQAAYQAMSA